MAKILIIDDDEDIRDLLSYNLEKEGFLIETAQNGLEGIKKALTFHPDLILLDVMMPEMDGIEVCENLRSNQQFKNTYICFLTARNEDYSQIAGLEAGADDYISKPIKPKVLTSKINAFLRRGKTSEDDSIPQASIIIDRDKYNVVFKEDIINLPRKEFELLSLLVSKPNSVFERDVILNKVWGTEIVVGDRTIDVHIRKLREKFGAEKIVTVKGIGYKYVD